MFYDVLAVGIPCIDAVSEMGAIIYRHFSFPQSSSASRLTAGAVGILALDPMARAAGPIGRVLALRDDALTAQQAGVLEDERPILLEQRIKHESPSRLANEPRQQAPSRRQWFKAQVAPVKLDQIERAEMHVAASVAQPVEIGNASFAAGHRLAVEQAGGRLERV